MTAFNPELFDEDAFWRNVAQIENGCWLWLRRRPYVSQCGAKFPVHHVAYALTYRRTVPHGRTLERTCGNGQCVNPTHMRLGRRVHIKDEFSALPVSRQRKHQLRRNKKGLCLRAGCAAPPIRGSLCKEHMVEARERIRKARGCVKRYRSLSYE